MTPEEKEAGKILRESILATLGIDPGREPKKFPGEHAGCREVADYCAERQVDNLSHDDRKDPPGDQVARKRIIESCGW